MSGLSPSIRSTQEYCPDHGITAHRVHWNGYDEGGNHRRRKRCMKCYLVEERERKRRQDLGLVEKRTPPPIGKTETTCPRCFLTSCDCEE